MPQPLSRVKKVHLFVYGPAIFDRAKEFGVPIAKVIHAWSLLEKHLAQILAALLSADAEIALEMYMAAANPRTQRDLVTAAAKAKLSEDEFILYSAIDALAWRVYRDRNAIAHTTWAVSP